MNMLIQFVRSEVESVMSTVTQNHSAAQGVMGAIQKFPPLIKQSWIGGDADEFEADVARKIIPVIMALIAAIMGINTNLSDATSIMENADSESSGLVGKLGDAVGKIF